MYNPFGSFGDDELSLEMLKHVNVDNLREQIAEERATGRDSPLLESLEGMLAIIERYQENERKRGRDEPPH